MEGRLHIKVSYLERMLLNKVPSWFNLISHQNRENLVYSRHIFKFNLEHGTGFWIHGSFPQLTRVHFTQTFVPLQC